MIFGVNYVNGNTVYSLDTAEQTYPLLESTFYAHFGNFQLIDDTVDIRKYDTDKTAVAELSLENTSFAPLKSDAADTANIIASFMRTCE